MCNRTPSRLFRYRNSPPAGQTFSHRNSTHGPEHAGLHCSAVPALRRIGRPRHGLGTACTAGAPAGTEHRQVTR